MLDFETNWANVYIDIDVEIMDGVRFIDGINCCREAGSSYCPVLKTDCSATILFRT